MTQKNNNIQVYFCSYLPYEMVPAHTINLGMITLTQAHKILDKFEKNTSRPYNCIQTMDIEFNDTVPYGRLPGFSHRNRVMNLSNMFYFYDVNDETTHAPCMAGKKQPKTEDAMVRACANNLRCGKCTDEFIRKTLGVALFPKFYAQDKQK